MQRCILYVEDDQDSVFFLKLAFKKAAIALPLVILEDGDNAIKYVLGSGAFGNRVQHPLPAIVLLDINLPKKSGFEVLELIRKTPSTKTLPVIILTSSPHPADIVTSRELGADHYLVKPSDITKLAQMMRMVVERWAPLPAKGTAKAAPNHKTTSQ